MRLIGLGLPRSALKNMQLAAISSAASAGDLKLAVAEQTVSGGRGCIVTIDCAPHEALISVPLSSALTEAHVSLLRLLAP